MRTSVTAMHTRVQVLIPGLLQSYTDGARAVTLDLAMASSKPVLTLADILDELDARYPGMRFRLVDEQGRIRPHIKMFLDTDLARELDVPIRDQRSLMIVGALSGG